MKIKLLIALFICINSYSQSALEIIEKSDAKLRGESSYSEITITIVRPKWQKTMTMKSWSVGTDYSVSLVTSPATYNSKFNFSLICKNVYRVQTSTF